MAKVLEEEVVEIRLNVPRAVADVLDASSIANRGSRNALVLRILTRWAHNKHHEASLVARAARVDPPGPDTEWGSM